MTKDEALKLALEALENDMKFVWTDPEREAGFVAIDAIKKALAQPEQELVELRTALAEALGDVYVCGRTWSAWGVGTMTQNDFYPAAESDDVLDSLVQAVATATPPPPKRPWVGLTKKEIDSALSKYQNWYDFAAHLENILKEKNQ